jgi:peptidoglycan/xylan/chitin deacetylase (PgdA/CDA1 family)
MFMRLLAGVGLGALVLPLLGVFDPTAAAYGTALAAVAIAIGMAAVVWWRRPRPSTRLPGGLVVGVCAWLFSQAPAGSINWVLAALLGLGLAVALPRRLLRDRLVLAAAAGSAALLVVVASGWSAGTAWTWGILCGVAAIGAAWLDHRAEVGRRDWPVPAAALLGVIVVGSWIGANSSTVSWFGTTISHGPRHQPQVAITFDDGPNAGATMAIAHILDAYGTKGTFFSVGKAVTVRPDITRDLIADGQLIGNHSYHHDEWRWLDPRYPELMRAQRTIQHQAGVCPAFYRPPHGQHTPFMAWVTDRHRMHMIGWDVSAGDWATTDPQLVARRVLSKVRPGSIIDLHDGLDGRVDADRSVLVRALPLILDGLQARGLQPVRLDQLLGRSGYTNHC